MGSDPYNPFTILEQRIDKLPGELWVRHKLAILPARQAVPSTDPERAVACAEQASNAGVGQRLTLRCLPGNSPDAVKPKEAEVRSQPQITVRRLSNRDDRASGEPFPILPRRVRVLAHVQRGVQGEGALPRPQQNAKRENHSALNAPPPTADRH